MSNETPAASPEKTKSALNTQDTDTPTPLGREYRPLRLRGFTPLFKAGWLLAIVIVCLSLASGLFLVRSRHNCPLWIAHPTEVEVTNGQADRCVTFERATTPQAWERGLSGRATMPVDRGMLFIFDTPNATCFWMKDMKFNLDIIWLDATKRVVYMQQNLSPATYPSSFCPDTAAQYVVEVNAGVAKAADIKIGTKLNL
jgi:uncharacterized membrane protein (UPF0127 family)